MAGSFVEPSVAILVVGDRVSGMISTSMHEVVLMLQKSSLLQFYLDEVNQLEIRWGLAVELAIIIVCRQVLL